MSKRILLIDDDESTILVVKAVLKMYGYEVIAFSSCQDIVEKVEEHTPCLVLMDVWMPGLGGEYAAKALKNNPSTSRIPVLLFSSEEELPATTARAGAEGAIAKPFDMLGLAGRIAEYIPVVEQECS